RRVHQNELVALRWVDGLIRPYRRVSKHEAAFGFGIVSTVQKCAYRKRALDPCSRLLRRFDLHPSTLANLGKFHVNRRSEPLQRAFRPLNKRNTLIKRLSKPKLLEFFRL